MSATTSEWRCIVAWLREQNEFRLGELFLAADAMRSANVGETVHLRGLIEVSSHCVRHCAYCGLRAPRRLERYRLTAEQILACAHDAVRLGYGTVVLQAGEDPLLTGPRVAEVVRKIKDQTSLAVTLSLGERSYDDLCAWKDAGADRYLLRFETSDRALYDRIHPPHGRRSDRIEMLRELRRIGYEIGSGVMVGIPGQTYDTLADDLLLFRELDLDMIGVGPWLAHPDTPLGRNEVPAAPEHFQVPASEPMVYKVVALTRLLCPQANIPSTTALATINKASGRELGLQRGANVIMPNLTPTRYRALYEIYPAKACVAETAEACHGCLSRRIESLGRTIGRGHGGRVRRITKEPSHA